MNGFSWYFKDRSAITERAISGSLEILSLSSCTEVLFLCLDPCLFETLQNKRWIYCYDILAILPQGAIGQTVSRLTRLFHAPQTRRGGGLRSCNASVWVLCRTSFYNFQTSLFYVAYTEWVFTMHMSLIKGGIEWITTSWQKGSSIVITLSIAAYWLFYVCGIIRCSKFYFFMFNQ